MNTVSNTAHTINGGYNQWVYVGYDWGKVFRITHLIGRLFDVQYFNPDRSIISSYLAYGDEFVYDNYPLGD